MNPRQTRKYLWSLLIMLVAMPLSMVMTTQPAMAQTDPCLPYEINKIYISTVADFDLSHTRDNGTVDIQEDGAHLETMSADFYGKAAEYMELADQPLISEITYYNDDYVHESGTAMGGQLIVDMDGNGVYTDGVDKFLVYEDAYQDEPPLQKWWSFYDFGVDSGGGYPTHDTLANIGAANPTLRLLHTGFSLGSGVIGKGVLKSIQVNCTMWVFDSTPPPQLQTCTSYTEVRVTPINDQGIDFSQTKSAGHYQYMADGLDIWTDDASSNAKVAGYIPVDYPLAELADFVLNYTSTTGVTPPGGQAVVDRTGDGLTADDGILVYEPGSYPVNVWWSNQFFGVDHDGVGSGYNTYGTINQILEVNPDARVLAVGFSLGSGVFGAGTVHSITAGCVVYVFGLEQVEVPDPMFTPIQACNTHGSLTPVETEGVVQTVTPENPTQGNATWSAEAAPGYELLNYTGPKDYDLGEYYTCPGYFIPPVVVKIAQCGTYGGVYVFDSPGVDVTVTPPNADQGDINVSATAQDGFHLVGYNGAYTDTIGTYYACEPEVVTETIVVTDTVVVTHTEVVTNVKVVTNTETISTEVPVTNTVIVTNTEVVTNTKVITTEIPVTTTITYVEAASPVFIQPTCAVRVALIYIPASDNFDYFTEGDAAPGASVVVRAVLKDGIEATPTGQTEFPFKFLSIDQLNCSVVFTEHIYFPQLEK